MPLAPKNLRVIEGGRRCPNCRKPTVEAFRPFCSKRCADIDMGRWFKESYRVPAEPVVESGDDGGDGGDEGGGSPRKPG